MRIILFTMAAVAGAVMLLATSPALAAPAESLPCMEEIEKFCKDVKPGGGRILACLFGHEKELSPACRAKAGQVRARLEEAQRICAADIRAYCAEVKPGEGRLLKCLQKQQTGLSPACREQVVKYGGTPAREPAGEKQSSPPSPEKRSPGL